MKRNRTRHMDRQGFTLIELLIVLAILVGIMALALPRLMGSRKKAATRSARWSCTGSRSRCSRITGTHSSISAGCWSRWAALRLRGSTSRRRWNCDPIMPRSIPTSALCSRVSAARTGP